jgi:hypothetical protein
MISQESVIDIYRNEAQAIEAFKKFRLKRGIVCKKCGETKHYWLAGKLQFQCSACRFRTTLRSGTLLEGSKLPVSYFFIAWLLLIKSGNNVTIEEFQKQTNHKYYEPLWEFLRRIKIHFKFEDSQKMAGDFIEITSPYFTFKNLDS